jgi:hypothetical protein
MMSCLHYLLAVRDIKPADQLTLLAVLIALSAYLATVRLFAIDKRHQLNERLSDLEEKQEDLENNQNQLSQQRYDQRKRRYSEGLRTIKERRSDISFNLLLLLIADVPMTLSAVLLGLYVLYEHAPSSFLPWSAYLFTFAGLALLSFHIGAWSVTLSKFRRDR